MATGILASLAEAQAVVVPRAGMFGVKHECVFEMFASLGDGAVGLEREYAEPGKVVGQFTKFRRSLLQLPQPRFRRKPLQALPPLRPCFGLARGGKQCE